MDGPGLEKVGRKETGIIIIIMAMVATTFLTAYQVHTVCVHNAIRSPMTLRTDCIQVRSLRFREVKVTQLLGDGARN